MTSPPRPPRFARFILRMSVTPGDRETLVDDLQEWYELRRAKVGALRSNIWYVTQVGRSAIPLLTQRLRTTQVPARGTRMHGFAQDLRYGLRMAKRSPLPTAAIITTLALGLGSAAAIASAVWSILLKPIPVPDPERVVTIQLSSPQFQRPNPLSYPDFQDWVARAQRFAAFGAYDNAVGTLITQAGPSPIQVVTVGDGFWRVLGATPALGRLLTTEDFATGAAPAVVLTHEFWMREFHSDPSIVGRVIRLDDGGATVVGVLPADAFAYPRQGIDLYRPMQVSTTGPNAWQSQRGSHWLPVIARVRPGVPVAAALNELRTIDAALATETGRRGPPTQVILTPLQESLVGNTRATLTLLAGIAALVLLIGVANVASLRLTQAQGRRREFGMRLVLGAGTPRLVRQVVTESLFLAFAGAAIGLLLAGPMLRAMVRLYPGSLPRADQVHVDLVVVGVTLLVAVAAGLAFALPQLLQLMREDTGQVTRLGARSGAGNMNQRMRKGLVVLQLAASVMLLIGSGLLLRTFWNLTHVAPGFNQDGVLTFTMTVASNRHPTADETEILFDRVLDETAHVPGVTSVGMTNAVPLTGNPWSDGLPRVGSDQLVNTDIRLVSPEYLQTLQVPLRAGRYFGGADRAGAAPVIIVNDVLARALFADSNVIGRTLQIEGQTRLIVGVVASLHQRSLATPTDPEIYFPFQQMSLKRLRIVAVRVAGDPLGALGAIRRIITAADPEIAVRNVTPLNEVVSQSIAPQRFRGALMGGLAALALILATIGLYGVTSYTVSQRTREFGIRIALGQTPSGMSRVVVREALLLSIVGIAVGVGAALLAVRALSDMVFGVATLDPFTLIAVPLLLGLVTVFAAAGPARRAGRVDPLRAIQG